jgi:tetratricopeptide (TPR) repeat protein/O-antigen ligase
VTWITRSLDAGIELGIVGLLLFAPLPFGGVRLWSHAVIEAAIALVAATWLLRQLSAGELSLRRHPALWPALVMAAVAAVQLLVPGRSVSPYATGESARLYAAYLVLLLVLSGHLTTRARILRLAAVIAAWGAVMALLGMVNFGLGTVQLLWLPKWSELNRLTATFLNPNHQALYYGVCLFVAIGLLLRPARRDPAGRAGPSANGREAPSSMRLAATVLVAGAILILGMAIILTLSRGAVVSALGGVATLLVLLSLERRRTRLPLVVVGGLVGFTAYAVWVGMEAAASRLVGFAREPFGELRWAIWDGTLRMALEAPVLGVGLGAYQDAFTRFRPPAVPVDKLVDFAHNDYLQLLAETGLVGLLALAWAMVGVAAFVLRRLLLRRDPFVKGLALGGFCALVATAIHSAVDFGLHRPANAIVVVAVTALLPAVVTLRAHRTGESVDLDGWRWPLRRATRVWGVGAVALGLLLAGLWIVPAGVADWKLQSALAHAGQLDRASGAASLRELDQARRLLEAAVWWDPRNPRAQAALAEVCDEVVARMWNAGVDMEGRRLPDPSVEARFRATEGLLATAYLAYQHSLDRRPAATDVRQAFGWHLGRLAATRRAIRETGATPTDARLAAVFRGDEDLVAQGLAQVTQAARLDPNNPPRQRSLALYALTFPMDEATSRRVATEAFRRTLLLEPRLLGQVVEDLAVRRADQELILDSVPRHHALKLGLGRQLDQRRLWPAAGAAFEEAIALAALPAQQVEARVAYGHALLRRKDHARAISQGRQALVAGPSHPEVFVLLGEAYESLGQLAEAEAAFASAVTLVGGADTSRRASSYRAHLASFLTRHGQGDRAVALWRQVLQTTPNDAWLRLELARTLEARGRGSEALVEYQSASSLATQDPSLQLEIGRAYARAGHLREAIEAYETAVRHWPSDVHETDVRWELAVLLVRAGLRERAIDHYRRILQIRPGHEGAQRGLADLGAQA